MAVTDWSVPLEWLSVSDGDASPPVVSVDRKFWGALEIWARESRVDFSRGRNQRIRMDDALHAAPHWFQRKLTGRCATPAPGRVSVKRPVQTSFCALVSSFSLCARIPE